MNPEGLNPVPKDAADREAMIDAVTDAALDALKVPRNLLGYGYLFLAVRYLVRRTDTAHVSMLRELYPYIAKKTGTGHVMVERAMRYAIARAWKQADPDVLYAYLGMRGTELQTPPTNVEFVYIVAERVRLIVGDPAEAERTMRLFRNASRFGCGLRSEPVDGGLPLC